jgi:hypothetical protein
MQYLVESKIYAVGNWIEQPEKIWSGLERARDYARKLVSNTNVPTKARICIREADNCRVVCGFERNADGGVSER